MITSWKIHKADSPSLKRSFGLVAGSGSENSGGRVEWGLNEPVFAEANELTDSAPVPAPSKRRSLSSGSTYPTMPVQTHPPSFPVSFPSFMSVFGTGSSMHGGMREENHDMTGHTYEGRQQQRNLTQHATNSHYPLPFPHRESLSSTNSESTDSSPTTTISTFDCGSVTDTTPSSSPESPTSVIPLSGFKTTMNDGQVRHADETKQDTSLKPLPNIPFQGESDNPDRRLRNARNLSVDVGSTDQASPVTSFPSVPAVDAPSIPALSVPVSPSTFSQAKMAARNRFNLSIRTPGLEKTSFLPAFGPTPIVPPTPAATKRPPVRHFPSEPSLSIFSPSAAPHGGMQFPLLGQASDVRFSERLSQSLHELKEEEDHYDIPESQEKKENGYPDGPVCIYDCGVYLYLEPSREEASKFDCIINVAKEVLCPFVTSMDSKMKESSLTSVMRHGHPEHHRHTISEPQTAVSEFSFKSAFEYQPLESPATPTTPKPEKAVPEYIHLPWDHNSDIVEDAYLLCKIIDQRVAVGKKVLVHCQLGVSRSASLIIAYGMFKDSSLDFNRAYENVKSRSKWISPNMSLIYQLTEFRSKLNKGYFEGNRRPAPNEWFKFGEALKTPTPMLPHDLGEGSQTISTKKYDSSKPLPPVPKFDEPMIPPPSLPSSSSSSSTGVNTPTPSTTSTATQTDPTPFFPRPFPLRERPSASRLTLALPPRPQYAVEMDLVSNDVPETPSILSPRATEFTSTPFHRTVAGDLALHEPMEISSPQVEDPRSPPHSGEAQIIRNIAQFL